MEVEVLSSLGVLFIFWVMESAFPSFLKNQGRQNLILNFDDE